MHLFHKVKGDFIKIKCNRFWRECFSTLDHVKARLNPWPLDLGNGEGEKSLSSYKREPRVVCKTSLKESISKSEHLDELFVEREEAAIFLKWARIPSRIFFLKRAQIPRSWAIPRHLVFVELYCSI